MSKRNGAEVEKLLNEIRPYSDRIASRLSDLAVTTDARSRLYLKSEILDLLRSLRQLFETWVITDFVEELLSTYSQLEEELLEEPEEDSLIPLILALPAVVLMRKDVAKALQSIASTASRLARGDNQQVLRGRRSALLLAQSAGVAGDVAITSIRTQLGDQLREQVVSVTGANGKTYRYDLGYYVSLVAHTSKGNAQKSLVLEAAARSGRDLVKVSENRSTIGDYCDLYRGKVFSISGNHPIYPPLSLAPAGGAPFHPWCHHTLSLFDDVGLTDGARRSLGYIPDDFLELGKKGASVNAYMELWNRRKSSLGF